MLGKIKGLKTASVTNLEVPGDVRRVLKVVRDLVRVSQEYCVGTEVHHCLIIYYQFAVSECCLWFLTSLSHCLCIVVNPSASSILPQPSSSTVL